MSLYQRWQPCTLLRCNEIPCVVWFEDAVAHYGVPTVVFDLHLLVPDPEPAARLFLENGWTVKQQIQKIGNATTDNKQYTLNPPTELSTSANGQIPAIILLCAKEWNFDFNRQCSDTVIPSLADLVDALIDSWLDIPDENVMLRLHISCMLGYLYRYVPELQKETFASELRKEHRRYHCDTLLGVPGSTVKFLRDQRQFRDEVREKPAKSFD